MMTLMIIAVLACLFLAGAVAQGMNKQEPVRIPVEKQHPRHKRPRR